MSRRKIDYGIDLGTTNSAIAKMENGHPIIIKSEGLQKDTTPSCVHFDRKGITRVGDQAYTILGSERLRASSRNDPSLINTFDEFKRTMGSDVKIKSENTGKEYSSEELSAEVLKALKAYIRDEKLTSIVITVPARFEQHQIDATQRAAEIAGFQYCELLQEPIASSFAYGLDTANIDGKWIVFDFGGGTFDVALMSAEEGVMRVIDTSGDNYLGGKNLDLAIVDSILVPYLEESYSIQNVLDKGKSKDMLRNALKRIAEDIKINMSSKSVYNYLSNEPLGEDDNGAEIEVDIKITQQEYSAATGSVFKRAIDITNKLLEVNNVTGDSLESVLMVGGPTLSETFRQMVAEHISSKINTGIDPMTVVAKGAALFASTKEIPSEMQESDSTKIRVDLKYPSTTVETEINVGVVVELKDGESENDKVITVELIRGDGGWSSGKLKLDGLADIVMLLLEEGKTNTFELRMYDETGNQVECDPDNFSIIQGLKVAGATLPYDICIDAFEADHEKQHLVPIKGLEKNTSLPAKGTEIFKTQEDIRPGKVKDIIKIPVYGGDPRTRSIYNTYAGTVTITGENLPGFLPKGSDVELTLRVDSSRGITVQASFSYLDEELYEETLEHYTQKTPSYEVLSNEITLLLSNADILSEDDNIDVGSLTKIKTDANLLNSKLENGKEDSDTKLEILNRIRELLKELDNLKQALDWPKMQQELIESLKHLEATIEQYGDEKAEAFLSQVKQQVQVVIDKMDSKMASEVISHIRSFDFAVVEQGAGPALWISFLKDFDAEFNIHDWRDAKAARNLINSAKEIIVQNRASTSTLRPIVVELFSLLPEADQPISLVGKGILTK